MAVPKGMQKGYLRVDLSDDWLVASKANLWEIPMVGWLGVQKDC